MVSTASIESRVTRGLQMKEAGEQIIAQALREKKDTVGTEAWLAWCLEQWGWSRSTAYRHLDPKQMEAAREDTQARREVPIIGAGESSEMEQGEEADTQA